MDDIRQECDNLVLRPGDLLVDPLTRSIGILMETRGICMRRFTGIYIG